MGLRGTCLCLALVAAVAGCGWISGLDNLSVDASTNDDDASEAGTRDAAVDDSSDKNEGSADGESADVSCPLTMSVTGCFGTLCSGSCCLTATGATCTNMCSGVTFGCMSASECLTSDAGNVCCLMHITEPVGQPCPYTLTAASNTSNKTSAACVLAGSCSGSAGENVRMCSDNAECPTAQICVKATLSTDPSVIFGICQ